MGEHALKILYHHRTRSRDGQSVHIDEVIAALAQLGHQVQVVEPKRIPATAEGIESRLFPRALYELLELGYSLLEFVKLCKAVITSRPDFIYERANLFTLSGLWASRLFRLPLLLEVNAPLAEERAKYGGLYWKRLAAYTEHACWLGASAVLPVTDALADYLRTVGVPENRITVTPNGVSLEKFAAADRASSKQRLGLGSNLVLGFVGYVREWHGLENVVLSLATSTKLAKAKLVIVGDGPARNTIQQRASELGLSDRVIFTGIVQHEELAQFISCFDIALQPRVTAYASPLKLFEYMALTCAIVAPSTPNICEILKHQENAYLFRPDHQDQFVAAIEALAENDELRMQIGQGALRTIIENDLTWVGNAKRIAKLGAELSGTSRRAFCFGSA